MEDRLSTIGPPLVFLFLVTLVLPVITKTDHDNVKEELDKTLATLKQCRQTTEDRVQAIRRKRDEFPLSSIPKVVVSGYLNPKQELTLGCVRAGERVVVLESNYEDGAWTLTCRGRDLQWGLIDL